MQTKNEVSRRFRAKNVPGLLLATAIALSGCADGGVDTPVPNVSVNARTVTSTPLPGGGDPVQLSTVKILLKRIRFHSADSDDSADVYAGPVVVVLNLQGGITPVAASRIPAGRYDRIRFRLHKPEDTEPIPDPEFRTGTSGDERFSVIVRGTRNGTAFEYRSRENAEQEFDLSPPLVVEEDGLASVILRLEPALWFVAQGRVLDPSVPDDARSIDDNIRDQFASLGN